MLAVFLADISLPNELIEESARPYMEEGGWATYPGDLLARPGPCNIQIRDSRLTQKEFMMEFATSRPQFAIAHQFYYAFLSFTNKHCL